jgi:predicted Zn finger-like uncharacterized protein
MNVTCPNCGTVYRVDPAKVPETGVRARCSICSAVFAVRHEGEAQEHAAPRAAATPQPPQAPQAPAPPAAAPAPQRTAPPTAPAPPPRPVPASATAAAPAPAMPASAPRSAASTAAPGLAAPATSAPAAPPPPPASPIRTAVPPAALSPHAPPASRPTPGQRPVNPFLSQDPALKARRLARALISDMVVYHPAKRQEGLRDGNLRELFDEEIKKSWEEYADQVGKDVADTTPYFREALNEILAGGRQVF